MRSVPLVIVPGLGGSDEQHWQSQWARTHSSVRVEQTDWYSPCLPDWIDGLVFAIERSPNSILVAHSLGCPLIAHAVSRNPSLPIRAALLVAPADTDLSPIRPVHVGDFTGTPEVSLPFPSITVVSSNDPYISVDRAQHFASAWRSQLINVGACGHINVASGFGPWPEGEEILRRLTSGLSDAELARIAIYH